MGGDDNRAGRLSQALQSVIGWASEMVQCTKAPVTWGIHMEEEKQQLSL